MMSSTSLVRYAVWLAVVAFFSLLLPYTSLAAEVRAGEQPSISKAERISDDIYIVGGNISSSGVAIGDLIGAGGNILVSGGVGGDLMLAGGSLTVIGNVADDVRVGGGNVTIQGGVGGDAVVGGGQLSIGGTGIKGDLLAGGGTVRVDTSVGGDVLIGGGDVYLNGIVSGNVQVYADKLTLGKNANIKGNLTYTASKPATMEDGAVVSGETTFKQVEKINPRGLWVLAPFAILGAFLTHLICSLFLGLFFKRYALEITTSLIGQPLMEMGRGLVTVIVLPVVSVILLITFLGIPLGILGLLAFIVIMIVLWMLAPVILGAIAYKHLLKKDYIVDWKSILLGVFIFTILGLIPLIGWLAKCALMLGTLGAMTKFKMDVIKQWR